MVKKISKDKKALAKFVKAVNNLETVNEEMESLSLKVHEVYANVVKKYLSSVPVIQFNYLENLKERTKTCRTIYEFKAIVESDIAMMEAKTEKTRIEEVEYLMAKKVHSDVVLGKGKEFEYGKDLSFKYDDQDIRYLGFFDSEKAKEDLAKNAKA
jgi:predicted Holliday junction resolvase-like endonuclease